MTRLTTRGPRTAQAIANREPFTTSGALRGESRNPGYYVYPGQLPRELAAGLESADYVVFSYSTPIAWHGPDGWTVPAVRYSITTSRHQGNLYAITGEVSRPVAGRVMRDGVGRVESSTGGVWS
jgi:hypothetical protein